MRQRLVNDHWLEHCRVSPSTVDQVEEIRTHQLLYLLDNPDPYGYFDRTKVLSLICRYTDVCGAAYFVPQRTTMSLVPGVLWPLYSQYVQPVHEAGSPLIDRYIYFADQLPFDAVLRFRLNDSLRDPYGLGYSPVYAAIEYAKLEDAFVSIQDQLLSSGPRPNIVFSPKNADDPPGEVERQRFETDLNRKLSAQNAGRVYVSNGAWDITPISYAPTDLAGKDISEYDIRGICSCFGIPPTIFTTDTNLANIEAAKQFHAENAVEPRCHMIAAVLTRFARRFDPRLFFAFDPAVREDEEKKNKILLDQLAAGAITINQFNQESQWPPVDYGNEPWISSGLRQPSMIQAEHQMSMTSQASTIENERKANEFQFSEDQTQDEDQPPDDQTQDMQGEARSIALDRMIDQEMRALESELRFMKQGNPYHDQEGHFTGTGGHTGRKPREPAKTRPHAAQEPSGHSKATGHQGQAGSRPEAKETPSKSKDSGSEKPKKVIQSKDPKAKPIRGQMAEAKREGTGKDAKVVMTDGSKAPNHVTPAMIAPSWTDVRVSVDPKAEVLVTARDEKGRPKMVTSESYDARSAVVKFKRVSEMVKKHDAISKEIQKARQKPETKEEADCAWLMQVQATRPGSETDTKARVKAYGATTLEARHVIEGTDGVRLQFIGKEGVSHDHLIKDEGLAKMLLDRKYAAASPDGKLFKTTDNQVRKFTGNLDGGKFSPKDFRTSAGTRRAMESVQADPAPSKDEKEHKARVKRVAEYVSSLLGNKPAEALKSYIHPAVFASWKPS